MAQQGWVSIHRGIVEHWMFQDNREFSKLEAWLDILLMVNHSPQKVLIQNTIVNVDRGQSIRSVETWGKRWNWSRGKVRGFFKLLEADSMIVTENIQITTKLTVCKYDSYQSGEPISNQSVTNAKPIINQSLTTNNNVNNVNNDNNEINKKRLSEFDTFWDLYKKDVGKSDAKKVFLTLPQEDVDRILLTVKNYESSVETKKYQYKAVNYLNKKIYNDEVILSKPKVSYSGRQEIHI